MTLLPISLSFIQLSPHMMRPRKMRDDCHRAVLVQRGTHGRYGILLCDHAYTLIVDIPLVCFITYRGLNKTTNILQITYWNEIPSLKIVVFLLKFTFSNAAVSRLKIVLSWLKFLRYFPNNNSSLVQILTSEQATSHNINPYLIGFVTPYGVIDKELIKRLSYISSKSFSRSRLCSESLQYFASLVLYYRYIKQYLWMMIALYFIIRIPQVAICHWLYLNLSMIYSGDPL